MKAIIGVLLISIAILSGCKDEGLEARVAALEKKAADRDAADHKATEKTGFFDDLFGNPIMQYTWFNLGQEYRQTVNSFFYISNIKTNYKENGFQVTGLIGNLTTMPMSSVRVQAAIKDSSGKAFTFGTTQVPTLQAGQKLEFSVFVPTSETKTSQVGIFVSDFMQ
jgi:hypothetical protein